MSPLEPILFGFLTGVVASFLITVLRYASAKEACEKMAGTECELRWVPVDKKEGK